MKESRVLVPKTSASAVFMLVMQLPLFPEEDSEVRNEFVHYLNPTNRVRRAAVYAHIYRGEVSIHCLASGVDEANVQLNRFQLHLGEYSLESMWACVQQSLERSTDLTTTSWTKRNSVQSVGYWREPLAWKSNGSDPVHPWARNRAMLTQAQKGGANSPEASIESELTACGELSELIESSIQFVLRGEGTGIGEALLSRPRLCSSDVRRLIAAAAGQPEHRRRLLQFLKTESYAVIDLAVNDHPQLRSEQVRECVIYGRRLPDLLMKVGITRAIHRRMCSGAKVAALGDARMSGQEFLEVLPFLKLIPLQKWPTTAHEVHSLLGIGAASESGLYLEMSHRCMRLDSISRFEDILLRASCVVEYSKKLKYVACQLTGQKVTFLECYCYVLDQLNNTLGRNAGTQELKEALDSNRVESLIIDVCDLLRHWDLGAITAELFALHPGLPQGFLADGDVDVTALTTLKEITDFGAISATCLESSEVAIRYVANAAALYGVTHSGRPAGVIALCQEGTNVIVWERVSCKEEESEFQIGSLSEKLAAGYADFQKWNAFSENCDAFRKHVGVG